MPNKINLKAISSEKETFCFAIGPDFFTERENSLINSGALDVVVTVEKNKAEDYFLVSLKTKGTVDVTCDRCLDNVEIPVETENEIKVKLGVQNEETETFTIVDKTDSALDMDSLIYDFTVLALPIHPVHPEGKCNEAMIEKLNKYLVVQDQ